MSISNLSLSILVEPIHIEQIWGAPASTARAFHCSKFFKRREWDANVDLETEGIEKRGKFKFCWSINLKNLTNLGNNSFTTGLHRKSIPLQQVFQEA